MNPLKRYRSWLRRAQKLLYPPYDKPFLSWFEGVYDTVYIALHPFFRLDPQIVPHAPAPDELDEDLVRRAGQKISWQEIAAATGMKGVVQLNRALLSTIGALAPDYQDQSARDDLNAYLEKENVYRPEEGFFPELLEPAFLAAFELASETKIINIDEFGWNQKKASLVDLQTSRKRFDMLHSYAGGFFPPNRRFLITGDWDSFFRLFCGDRDFLEQLVKMESLDGFFCDPKTSHFWFDSQ